MIPEIPTTAIAGAAAALASEACEPFLLHHSYRTYLFGRMLVPASDVDEEAAFVAAMIHDLGLTEAHSGDKGFDEVGADLAARFLEKRGWDAQRIHLVEQAIVRHTDLVPNDVPELLIVQAGAALDVAGIPQTAVGAQTTLEIINRYPRTGFAESMRAAYLAEIADQPNGAFAQLEENITLSAMMLANPL